MALCYYSTKRSYCMFVYLLFLYVITIVICRALRGLNLEKKNYSILFYFKLRCLEHHRIQRITWSESAFTTVLTLCFNLLNVFFNNCLVLNQVGIYFCKMIDWLINCIQFQDCFLKTIYSCCFVITKMHRCNLRSH